MGPVPVAFLNLCLTGTGYTVRYTGTYFVLPKKLLERIIEMIINNLCPIFRMNDDSNVDWGSGSVRIQLRIYFADDHDQ
jgi:hypothetical protein